MAKALLEDDLIGQRKDLFVCVDSKGGLYDEFVNNVDGETEICLPGKANLLGCRELHPML